MRVRVRLFAVAKDIVGSQTLDVEMPDDGRVADLRAAMVRQCPQLADVLQHSTFAVDADYARDDDPVTAGTDIACIPPVSGG